ncbi:type II toxin-antitoxin system RelE/ParE family toxin [Reichenbachiella sp. MALMAid0571]|uniref:type II toxin-antitoxin system RelE/ParE family toxin n=1 Tax=Reichenbachiella sp. MALMAid0571 TaxID=3143939 RepID=UPI0032DF8F99
MAYKIKAEPEAHDDIQEGIDWYNEQKPGLGRKFHAEVKTYFKKLKTNPFFQVRYDDVHCLPIKKYPYMIHFTIDEENKIVTVKAVFNTSKDPKKWKKR